ncbi:MAG: DUF559 domain-containing protein [Chloroflexi bacterium]|nr:DUF559 domain-containing protein [Chloroflexota bacterium]
MRRKQNTPTARTMRHDPTNSEEVLWERLRNRKVAGLKFRRQHTIDRFIVDFFCAEAHLVIEVDGLIHDEPNADAERQEILETLGLRVLRFTNEQILKSLKDVVDQITQSTTPPPE